MVKRPVISIVSQQLFNFENGVSTYVHYYPHLVGKRFGELAFLFADGIVMGLVDRITGTARWVLSSGKLRLSALVPQDICTGMYLASKCMSF